MEDASDVVEYYQSFKRKKLQRSIGGGFLETKSIYYSAADILDWLCVIDCIEQQGKKVTNVQFTFAAYDKNTPYRDANDTAYHQQICFVIQIFSGNKLVDVQKLLWKDKQFNEADYDTGKPCPTRCPSGILLPAA